LQLPHDRFTGCGSLGSHGFETSETRHYAPGSDGGARHWAIAMTLIQTAKLDGVNPMAYLADNLERIISGRTKQNGLHSPLPWNWTATTSATITSQAA
jgi:hypothetical protein